MFNLKFIGEMWTELSVKCTDFTAMKGTELLNRTSSSVKPHKQPVSTVSTVSHTSMRSENKQL